MPTSMLTPEQRQAVVTRDVSILLSSGAGCGKTHVLTERYLSHLRDGVEVGQLAAITFTERAARQMRGRIRQAVLTHLRESSEDEAERWARHLRNLETASICTIHSFCGTLLRQSAVEAGLDPDFDVLEDVLAVNLGSEARTEAVQKLLTAHGEAGDDLRQLVLLYGWRPIVEAVHHLSENHDGPAWQRWLARSPTELAAEWQQFGASDLRSRYLQFVLATRPKISRLLPLLKRHPPATGPLVENVRILQAELPELPTAPDLAEAVERLCEAAKVVAQGKKAWPDPDVYELIKNGFKDFRDDLRGLNLERLDLDPASLVIALDVGQRFLRVASETQRVYQERKHQHAVVDFHDLLVMARDLLRDRAEVRERLRERYQYLLIDELQDTDPVQMELVASLCGDELSTGKLFAVGDASQSIYRFRRADVSLFQQLRQKMPAKGRQALTLNFRSQPAILDFVNVLVGDRLSGFEPLQPHLSQVNPEPCVELLWTAREDGGAAAKRQGEAEGVARRLAAMIGRERLVVERTLEGPRPRPVQRGDVVLLFRSMSNVHLYEAALRKYGLDYYLVGGRAFFAQQEIHDLLNLLRALENPRDDVALVGALRSPFFCLSDETLFSLRWEGGHRVPFWTALHEDRFLERVPGGQRAAVLRARGWLSRWRPLKDRLPIARLLGAIFADSGYDAAMQLEFLGERKLANLWKLLDLARTFDRSGLFGLAHFIARLGDLVENQPREEQAATQPENADVVRLMSIHQAKGLEFPVVVLPDLDTTVRGSFVPVAHWDARLGCAVRPPEDEDAPFDERGWALWRMREEVEDWNESLRILYVACTRAQDHLILSAALPADLNVSSAWLQTLAAKFDLRTGQCLVPAEPLPRCAVRGSAVVIEEEPPALEKATVTLPKVRGRPEPIPLLATAQGVVSVEEAEAFLLDPVQAHAAWERGAFADPVDDEPTPLSTAEDVIRFVLRHADLRDAHQWQPLLRRCAARSGLALEETRELEESFEHFLNEAGQGRFLEARHCWRRQPFLLPWPDERRPGPVVRGTLDLLWLEGRSPYLLWLTTQPAQFRPGLVFWVHAARQLCGTWPKSVEVYSLREGRSLSEDGKRWRSPTLLKPFAEALTPFVAHPEAAPS